MGLSKEGRALEEKNILSWDFRWTALLSPRMESLFILFLSDVAVPLPPCGCAASTLMHKNLFFIVQFKSIFMHTW